jgi:hypothetical protein
MFIQGAVLVCHGCKQFRRLVKVFPDLFAILIQFLSNRGRRAATSPVSQDKVDAQPTQY